MARSGGVAAFHADGQLKTVTRNGIVTRLTHSDANLPLTGGYAGGTFAGLSMRRTDDSYLQMDAVAATNGPTQLQAAAYGYRYPSKRFTTVIDGAFSAVNSYVPKADRVVTRSTDRQGEHFRKEITAAAGAGCQAIADGHVAARVQAATGRVCAPREAKWTARAVSMVRPDAFTRASGL